MSQRLLTKAELSERFGESPKQIERYIAEGMPCRGTGRTRKFNWHECRRWRDERIKRLERERVERNKPADIDDARARKEAALAEKAEIEVAQLRGELIPLELHEQRVESLCVRLAGPVKGLSRYIADVQRASSAVEAAAVLDRVSDGLLRALQGEADGIDAEAVDVEDDAAA